MHLIILGQNKSIELDVLPSFFSLTYAEHIISIVQKYPKFLENYKDIAVFRTKPKELIYVLRSIGNKDKLIAELSEQLAFSFSYFSATIYNPTHSFTKRIINALTQAYFISTVSLWNPCF